MITIYDEITIDLGEDDHYPLTLWLVSHGAWPDSEFSDQSKLFLDALYRLCARQGWLMECSHESYEDTCPVLFNGRLP